MSAISVHRHAFPWSTGLAARFGWGIVLSFLLTACTIRLVSAYDEATDKGVTALQTSVDTFLGRMDAARGTAEGGYAANSSFYITTAASLSVLQTRAKAIEKNALTVEQIGLLTKTVEDLRQIHQNLGEAGLPTSVVDSTRIAVDTQVGAILKLELAKKRE